MWYYLCLKKAKRLHWKCIKQRKWRKLVTVPLLSGRKVRLYKCVLLSLACWVTTLYTVLKARVSSGLCERRGLLQAARWGGVFGSQPSTISYNIIDALLCTRSALTLGAPNNCHQVQSGNQVLCEIRQKKKLQERLQLGVFLSRFPRGYPSVQPLRHCSSPDTSGIRKRFFLDGYGDRLGFRLENMNSYF